MNQLRPSIDCPEPILSADAQGLERVAVDDAAVQLTVTFVRPLSPAQQIYALNPRSYTLSGGERLFPKIIGAMLNPPGTPLDQLNRRVLLQLDQIGDFGFYTLTVSGSDVDPFFASRKLRFRLTCDDPFDCREPNAPSSPLPELPVSIEYLAKDYASFRQALLDFIPTRLPDWTERSEADIGMMLLELFAATADNLSYMQDRVANEAFLSSATQRRSIAAHLALIGYELDEGAAAHTWLQLQVNSVETITPAKFVRVSTNPAVRDRPPDQGLGAGPARLLTATNQRSTLVFETIGVVTLRPEHNRIPVYTWNNADCCLPRNAETLTLEGEFDQFQIGDYLLLDDGQGQRDVVRLVAKPEIIPADPAQSPPHGSLTTVRWSQRCTPLHAAYCTRDMFVRGNVIVATHGEKLPEESLRALSDEQKEAKRQENADRLPGQRVPRQRLTLAQAPLVHLDTATLDLIAPVDRPAVDPFNLLARKSRYRRALQIEVADQTWQEQSSLLDSAPDEQVYRVEMDDSGFATVVFGDNVFGQRPDETADISATYRVGGGAIGNLAADTLTLPQPPEGQSYPWLDAVTNPLPSTGGRDPETRDHARRFGPAMFKQPLVAVTAEDYANAAQSFTTPDGDQPIQRARALFRWTGSWLTVTLAVDPRGEQSLDDTLRRDLVRFLDTRRLAGYDLRVIPAIYVPLELALTFCIASGFRPLDVQQGIQQVLSSATLQDGRKGLFHPDHFSFGDDLYVSRIYAAVMTVPGVESAQITRLARLHAARPDRDTATNLRQGYLAIGADEIIQLDNDRNFPEHGTLLIRTRGGG